MLWLINRWRHLSPPALLVFSFVALVAMGTSGLLLLPGLYTGPRLGLLDALFTATSAVCVTGLIVVDTATYFTFWGQLWVLALIQLGGLGLITLTTLVIGALGRRLSLRSEMIALPTMAEGTEVVSLALAIARFTFVVEMTGALVLWTSFGRDFGLAQGFWHAVFQAVSGYCNAGFSTFTTSLEDFATRSSVILTISLLVVIGGLGYLTTEELLRFRAQGGLRSRRRLSTHSFAVVATTTVLLLAGTVLFTMFEWHGVLARFGILDRILNGWFMSVTPRTAGFNTVPYGEVGNETAFLTIIFMVIGGSPGSTAGGMKTTAWAILAALAFARARGRRHVEIHGRTVPDGTVQRTVSIVLLGFAMSVVAVFLLGVVQPGTGSIDEARREVLPLIFEAVSAFGTVGLSMGYTQQLGALGKLITIVLMFVGRVGPLAFFAAISIKASRDPTLRAANEDLIVG